MNASKILKSFFSGERALVAFFLILFALSSSFLFWKNEQGLDPNYHKSWWVVQFSDPHDQESLAFTIENFGQDRHFTYEILENETVLEEEGLSLSSGESRTVAPDIVADAPGARYRIVVSDDAGRKEIYR